jgi:AcrR family transcriptional regulator
MSRPQQSYHKICLRTYDKLCNIWRVPRGSRSQPTASTDGARERILAAAQRCVDRHGIRKTTIDDIASASGLSRPSVYRYFADRDDLLVELITRHGQALLGWARKSFSRQSGLPDQIVESLLYIADHGRRDPLTRYLIDPDGTSLGQRMMASPTSTAASSRWCMTTASARHPRGAAARFRRGNRRPHVPLTPP